MRLSLNTCLAVCATLVLSTGCTTGKSFEATEDEVLTSTDSEPAVEIAPANDDLAATTEAIIAESEANAAQQADAATQVVPPVPTEQMVDVPAETPAEAPADMASDAAALTDTSEPNAVEVPPPPALASEPPPPMPDPAPSTVATTESSNASTMPDVYVVRPGDTLSEISLKILGTSKRWRELAAANGITNPGRMVPGDKIRYRTPTTPTTVVATRTHTVRKHETLFSIARKIYGAGKYWPIIWRQNEGVIPNPDTIEPGMRLSYNPNALEAH